MIYTYLPSVPTDIADLAHVTCVMCALYYV